MEIDGRWHQFTDALKDGRALLAVKQEGSAIYTQPMQQVPGVNRMQLLHTLGLCEKLPMLVVSPRLEGLVREHAKSFTRSLSGMVEAGVFKLPFPELFLQMPDPDTAGVTCFVMLKQFEEPTNRGGTEVRFVAQRFGLARMEASKEKFAVLFPSLFAFDMLPIADEDTKDLSVPTVVDRSPFMEGMPDETAALTGFGVNSLPVLSYAAIYAGMVWRTKGVETVEQKMPRKLNKARGKRGDAPLRDYSLIRIAKVYDREGREHAFSERAPMPVHWRIGHWRNVACGPGHKDHRRKWIDPILVNYTGGEPPIPKYLMAG